MLQGYGGGAFSFSRLVTGITVKFNTDHDLRSIEDFVAKNPDLGSGSRAFNQAIEKTKSNIKWMTKNYAIVSTWLQSV